MDAFSYLSVLLSIILGLAITQVLQGVRGMLLRRAQVRLYWPSLLWCVTILALAMQSWWAGFGLADHAEWTFGAFTIVLVQTTLLYMLAALVLPDFAGDPVDLHEHYYREARPFFICLLAMLATSFLKDVLLDGRPPHGTNLIFRIVLTAGAAVAITTSNRRYHEALSAATVGLIAFYIVLLFSRLG